MFSKRKFALHVHFDAFTNLQWGDDLKVDDYRKKSGIKTRFLALRKLSSKKGIRITNVASSVILEGEDYGSKVSIKHL